MPRTKQKEGSASSATRPRRTRNGLTPHEWLSVFSYVDKFPDASQGDVVKHFASKPTQALFFTQPGLSRNLQRRSRLEKFANAKPCVLPIKRLRLVTSPDVDCALALWVEDLISRHEDVTLVMLKAKRKSLEDELNVPDEERVLGIGWIPGFYNRNGLKQIRVNKKSAGRGSLLVEPNQEKKGDSVEELKLDEQARIRKLLARFDVADRWNVDESSLSPCNERLIVYKGDEKVQATTEAARLSICLACNADGSERKNLFFLGKQRKSLGEEALKGHEFYYRTSKGGKMKKKLFEEWIKQWDLNLQKDGRRIALTLDNHASHDIQYKPKNITFIFFRPNLTSILQPLDTGIIASFHEGYNGKLYNLLNERDRTRKKGICNIDRLEIMEMATEAWKDMDPLTIARGWNKAGIQ